MRPFSSSESALKNDVDGLAGSVSKGEGLAVGASVTDAVGAAGEISMSLILGGVTVDTLLST